MSWDSYIDNLLKSDWVEDAVIVGHKPGQESVWAAAKNGWLSGITAAEVKALLASERSSLFTNGVTLAGRKCTVVRDGLNTDDYTMDLKMKPSEKDPHPLFLSIGKSENALIIARGVKDAPGGKVNPPVYDMTSYLRKLNH